MASKNRSNVAYNRDNHDQEDSRLNRNKNTYDNPYNGKQ